MIALVDYRAGNLTSVRKALAAVGADVFVPTTPDALKDAAGVIVPGVGHFDATRVLDQPWVEAIRSLVADGRPLLGICLGMQWLFEGSAEAPDCPGLGLLAGRCYRLTGESSSAVQPPSRPAAQSSSRPAVKVPHVGWNALAMLRTSSIAAGVPDAAQMYFTHSYVAPLTGDTVAEAEHGERFAAIVERGRVAGVQFHPEKSGDVGLRILRNFVQSAPQQAA